MNKRLAWSQIRDFFEGHWIELVDVEWSDRSLFPHRARVRNFATDRSSLLEMISQSKKQEGTVVLYVGNMSPLIAVDSKQAVL
jgi:hypothetical protein